MKTKSLLLCALSVAVIALTGCPKETLPPPELPPELPPEIEDVLSFVHDPVFRAYCEYCMENETRTDLDYDIKRTIPAWDTNGDGKLSSKEAAAVPVIDIDRYSYGDEEEKEKVTSMSGIEYFTGLTHLCCFGNELTSLDISKNTKLTYLDCGQNALVSLDISQNILLDILNCIGNKLSSLDVSKNTELFFLRCNNNKLETLDVSNNTSLECLICGSNELTTVDLSKNKVLTELLCGYNYGLSTLDLSDNTALTDLECNGCQLTSLDISKNTALTYLDCEDNQIASLDISRNRNITIFYCDYNPGDGATFVVKAWFDNDNIPSGRIPNSLFESYHYTKKNWKYNDGTVITIDYQKVT